MDTQTVQKKKKRNNYLKKKLQIFILSENT